MRYPGTFHGPFTVQTMLSSVVLVYMLHIFDLFYRWIPWHSYKVGHLEAYIVEVRTLENKWQEKFVQ